MASVEQASRGVRKRVVFGTQPAGSADVFLPGPRQWWIWGLPVQAAAAFQPASV
jgi:hypothetical protein